MSETARSQFLLVLAAVVGVLVFASAVSRVLNVRAADRKRALAMANLDARIRSWWWMSALLAAAILLGAWAIVALFAAVSMLAMREFMSTAREAGRDRALDALCLALVALQYGVVVAGNVQLVALLLPLATMTVLPAAAIFTGGVHRLQFRIAHRMFWVMAAGWALSHIPALLLLDPPGFEGRNVLLVVYLVIVTQGSDVLQYVFGKLYGRTPIAPRISPDKTVEGFVGGVASATAIGTALAWMTPFAAWQAALVSLLLTLLGFLGGLVLSGIKRDLGIKDWSRAIDGHGGVLDRVDSLLLSAPALFHMIRFVWPLD